MAMTSVTRSRRADGPYLTHPTPPSSHRLTSSPKPDQQLASNSPRAKRQLEPSGRDFDPTATKRARFTTGIAVEIPARASFHNPRFHKEPISDVTPPAPAPPPARAKATATATVAGPNAPAPKQSRSPPAKTANADAAAVTRHQEKVANGLKHELNRLQPNAADTKEQGRKLRSQESVRYKSELSNYFPDYDEVIGNEPPEQHTLTLETPILIAPDTDASQQAPPYPYDTTYPVRSYSDALFTDLFESQRIDFSFLNKGTTTTTTSSGTNNPPHPLLPSTTATITTAAADSLPDTLFSPAHKRAARLERSIRNSEKGRAQHEKDQIIRLLDGLQGHDWLRVMGVSGITESRKRAFEPARAHFIRGCEGILEKFRRWAAEEKRRRVEKDHRVAAAAAVAGIGGEGSREGSEGLEGGGGREEEEEEEKETGDREEDGEEEEEEVVVVVVKREPPDDSDVDASVAKQLREEALAAAAKKKKAALSRRSRGGSKAPPAPPPLKPEPERIPAKEFTSFFAKRYQREAALNRSRRKGRTVLAWGQPLPDMEEADFELPAELRDEHILRTRARGKRRDKRGKP
ncbi:hypothetical protein BT67DRAFT_457383 [Trichocladium antarcticum]|uniref:Something about silencing protein 4 domain-containing protein n=1 Tax=Trichocladium antarcticum TaxID=1450529 RepID=A0AAN6UFW6_9PEZI|nr:hypothetical protein BT67DRAFT_457383 [Trichocladium antarcticum]